MKRPDLSVYVTRYGDRYFPEIKRLLGFTAAPSSIWGAVARHDDVTAVLKSRQLPYRACVVRYDVAADAYDVWRFSGAAMATVEHWGEVHSSDLEGIIT